MAAVSLTELSPPVAPPVVAPVPSPADPVSALPPLVAFTRTAEARVVWVPARPVTFDEFLELFGEDDEVELIDGTPVEKTAAQLDHEKLFAWLLTVLNYFASDRDLGLVLGARSPVKINNFRGRLPDLLFVRRERLSIVQQKAIYGAPDLVIEFVSPGDRPSDVVALETDCRGLGVAEIVFVQSRRRVRALRRQDGNNYAETEQETGPLAFASVPGFVIQAEWLWADARPAVRDVLAGLLGP